MSNSSLILNSNIASLNAQRRLSNTTNSLQRSYERLSSGLRINRASDDASGLAISSSLNIDSRVFTQGIRNVNDAISLYAIAESALDAAIGITTRLKELAEQSANGVLSYTQRKSLDKEAQQLAKEYLRIIQTAQFNDLNIINGNSGALNIQSGYDSLSLTAGKVATGGFATKVAISSGANPTNVMTGDLNGDGIIDLVSGDYVGNSVSVYFGIGDGTFQSRRSYSTGGSINYSDLKDINGDGIKDIIAADSYHNDVRVLIGNSDGSFKVWRSYGTTPGVGSVTAADMNGDGRMDLITANHTTSNFSVMLGNGDGTFLSPRTFGDGNLGFPNSLISTDINGDGLYDIVVANYVGAQLNVFLNNGDMTFKRSSLLIGANADYVTSSDLNGDGIADLITATNTNQLVVFIGNGDGTFLARKNFSIGSRAQGMAFSDVNWDGKIDLISADRNSNQMGIFLGNGDGSFKAETVYQSVSGPSQVAVDDFNGDGIADLVVAERGASQLGIFLGNSDAQIASAIPLGSFSLLFQNSSRDALKQFGTVLNSLTNSLGAIGANESRLQAVVNVLQQTRENYERASSQIKDVDVAEEAGNLTRSRILQNAGAAILSQANQQPTIALQLLRDI